MELHVVDMHTAGEPVRIVTGGYPELLGATILEKRREARELYDHLRRALMLEPRGHAGMYGVIPVKPSTPHTVIGALFTHNEGYSTMCGHATIALGRWLVESGAKNQLFFRPWLIAIPGAALVALIFAINLLGDA